MRYKTRGVSVLVKPDLGDLAALNHFARVLNADVVALQEVVPHVTTTNLCEEYLDKQVYPRF